MKTDNPFFQIISLLMLFGPIILFWYIDWYWIIGYYNLFFAFNAYFLFKQYNNDSNFRRKYHPIIYIGLPLIFCFIGFLVSILNGFEEIRDEDRDFKKDLKKPEDKKIIKDKVENQSEITYTNNRETFKNFFSDDDINEVSLILLGPTRSNTDIVVFEGKLKNIEEDLEYFFDEYAYEYIEKLDLKNYKKTINIHENIIDFYGIENNIPKGNIVYITVPSQHTLSYLKIFLPNERFVSYKRWGWRMDSYTDEAYMTSKSDKFKSDIELDNLPGNENFSSLNEIDCYYFEPNELRIFKLSDYNDLIKKYNHGMLDLKVQEYNKPKLI